MPSCASFNIFGFLTASGAIMIAAAVYAMVIGTVSKSKRSGGERLEFA